MMNQLISVLKNEDLINLLITIFIVPIANTLITQIISSKNSKLPIVKIYIGGSWLLIYIMIMSTFTNELSDFLVFFLCYICDSMLLNIVIIGLLTLLLLLTSWKTIAWILSLYMMYVMLIECGFSTYGTYFPITIIVISIIFSKPIVDNRLVKKGYIATYDDESDPTAQVLIILFYFIFNCFFILGMYELAFILKLIILILSNAVIYGTFSHEIYCFSCSRIDLAVSGQIINNINVHDIDFKNRYIIISTQKGKKLIKINRIDYINCYGNNQIVCKKKLLFKLTDDDLDIDIYKKLLFKYI